MANEIIPFFGYPELPLYDAALKAVAAARRVDEVKNIRNAAIAMKALARQAEDKTMEADAAAIRIVAAEKLGEMMEAQAKTVGLAKGRAEPVPRGLLENPRTETVTNVPATLAEAGISKNLAHEARKMHRLAKEGKLEKHIQEERNKVLNRTYTPRGWDKFNDPTQVPTQLQVAIHLITEMASCRIKIQDLDKIDFSRLEREHYDATITDLLAIIEDARTMLRLLRDKYGSKIPILYDVKENKL